MMTSQGQKRVNLGGLGRDIAQTPFTLDADAMFWRTVHYLKLQTEQTDRTQGERKGNC